MEQMLKSKLRENYDTLCRFCLEKSINQRELFDKIQNNVQESSQFQNMGLKLSENDGLPCTVCSKCYKFLQKFWIFYENCLKSQNLLEGLQNEIRAVANKSPKSFARSNGNERQIRKIGSQCSICGKVVKRLSDHLLTHTKDKPHVCEHCLKTFSTRSNLLSHIKVHSDIKKYKCQVCSNVFKSHTNLTRHLRAHNNARNNACSICALKFKTNQTLQQHRQRVHAKNPGFDCSQCDHTFYNSHHLHQHVRKTHDSPKQLFKCNVCDKTLKSQVYLRIHERTHSDDMPCLCTICNKTFSRASSLKIHTMRCHETVNVDN